MLNSSSCSSFCGLGSAAVAKADQEARTGKVPFGWTPGWLDLQLSPAEELGTYSRFTLGSHTAVMAVCCTACGSRWQGKPRFLRHSLLTCSSR